MHASPHRKETPTPTTPRPHEFDRSLLPSSNPTMGSGLADHDPAEPYEKSEYAKELHERLIRVEKTSPSAGGVYTRMVCEDKQAMKAGLLHPSFGGPQEVIFDLSANWKALLQKIGCSHPSSSMMSTPAPDAVPQIESTMSTTALDAALAQLVLVLYKGHITAKRMLTT